MPLCILCINSVAYFVYILECVDGTLYTGWTNDLTKRVYAHNNSKSGARYTKSRRPVVLKYSKKYRTKSVAMKREAEIKKMERKEKEKLLAVSLQLSGKKKNK